MEKELENADSLNGETENADSENSDQPKENELIYTETERKLFERVKKAEGEKKILREQLKKFQAPEKTVPQSSEPDYAKEAYLEGRGYTHPDDKKIIYEEANRLKLPLGDVLGMEHIKSKLSKQKDDRESGEGMPKGSGSGKGVTKNNVDYWIDRKKPDGTYDTPADLDQAAKVIEARIKRETTGNKFSDDLF